MMGQVEFLPEGTLTGGHPLPGEQPPGSNGIAVSTTGGTVWVSDPSGTLACVDPATRDVLDGFSAARSDVNGLSGRLVTQSGSVLYMDGSGYLLRLDPPPACGPA
ncbi:MAG TPA: PQQ-binding-like beta-propeller repeat protein [Actinomycetota bacterium]